MVKKNILSLTNNLLLKNKKLFICSNFTTFIGKQKNNFTSVINNRQQQQQQQIQKQEEQQQQQQQQKKDNEKEEEDNEKIPPKFTFNNTMDCFNLILFLILTNDVFKINFNSSNDIIDNDLDFLYKSKEDFDLFFKKIIYQLDEREALIVIFNCFGDCYNGSNLQMIESGVHQYCIDYLMKHLDYQLMNNVKNTIPKGYIDMMALKLQYLILSNSSLKEIANQFENYFSNDDLILFTSICYRTIINISIDYFEQYGLSSSPIEIPHQLKHIILPNLPYYTEKGSYRVGSIKDYPKHFRATTPFNNSQLYLPPNSCLPYERKLADKNQIIEIQKSVSNQNVVFSMIGTALYIVFRKNIKWLPKMNKVFTKPSYIFLSSLTSGVLLFFTSEKNKSLYDHDLKNFQDKYIVKPITSILPSNFNPHLDFSWLYTSIAFVLPLAAAQPKKYFIFPFIIQYLYFNLRKNKNSNNPLSKI